MTDDNGRPPVEIDDEDEFADPEATKLVSGPLEVPVPDRGLDGHPTSPDLSEVEHVSTGKPTLVIIHGASMGQRFVLEDRNYSVGRSETCDIALDDDTASRLHCEIAAHGDRLTIKDLDSRNGTFVNDVVAVEPLEAGDADVIRVGRTLLKFLCGRNVENAYFEEIHRAMTTDGLTGALNRRGLDAELERRWYEWRRYKRSFSLVMFDLGHFKRVNDTHGHRVGDRVLAAIGRIVLDMKRLSDAFGRYGGEEFVLVLPETPLDSAVLVAERLRARVASSPFGIEGHSFPVTVSLGAAIVRAETESLDALVQETDARLYQAKQAGRNRVVPAPAGI